MDEIHWPRALVLVNAMWVIAIVTVAGLWLLDLDVMVLGFAIAFTALIATWYFEPVRLGIIRRLLGGKGGSQP